MPARNNPRDPVPRLKSWQPDKQMRPAQAVLVIGKRGSGKTTSIQALTRVSRKMPYVMLMTGTKDGEKDFEQIIPPSQIFYKWQPDVMASTISTMERVNEERGRKKKTKLMLLAILDDLAYDRKFLSSPEFLEVILNGRHSGIKPIVAVQNALSFKPEFRNNFDWVIIMRTIVPGERRRYYEHYCEALGSYEQFLQVYDEATENFGCLVVNNCARTMNVRDNFFVWRAPITDVRDPQCKISPWRAGSKELWRRHIANFDASYSQRCGDR
jgi:energy-coupling factor transporter ATP-binding protein EcfA2